MQTVSVIITTHNRPRLLPAAIESAKAAGRNVEVVVVDDASADETAAVCRNICDIRYVRVERNQRVAGARNVGLLASRGEYVTFLDDDDVRLPGSLDLQSEALASAPEAGLIYARALVADQGGDLTGDYNPKCSPQGDVFWELLRRNFIPCGTALFRRSCLFRVGLLDGSVPGIDDWDLWVRISALHDVVALEEPVMLWRRSTPVSGQGTSRASEMVARATRQFRRKWMKLPRAAEATARRRREAWRQFSRQMAAHLALETARALKYGHLLRSQKNLAAALSLHPWGSVRLATSPAAFRSALARAKGKARGEGFDADFTRGRTD
ncbi:MAG TPA: glycosyltransferase family A protein [Pyrinomonadaceae bacterium]|nr:glycosyltransferase family A protein [Pyrinomonadaceae bacterium]